MSDKTKTHLMTRPVLQELSLEAALEIISTRPRGECFITMSSGQWDSLLENAYLEGWVLLELNEDEQPVRAFQRKAS